MAALQQETAVTVHSEPFQVDLGTSTSAESSDSSENLIGTHQIEKQVCSTTANSVSSNYLQSMQDIVHSHDDFTPMQGIGVTRDGITTGEFYPSGGERFEQLQNHSVKNEFGNNHEPETRSLIFGRSGERDQLGIREEESAGVRKKGHEKEESPPTVYPWMKRIHVSHGMSHVTYFQSFYIAGQYGTSGKFSGHSLAHD